MAQIPPTDENNIPSAPTVPPPAYQDKPPSYDEAISGKDPVPDADGFNYPTQHGLQNKGEYYPSAQQFGPGPPPIYQPNIPQGQVVHLPEGTHGCPPGIIPSFDTVEFRQYPIKVTCPNCSSYNFTRVEDKINSEGWLWCILCCCCGIWLLSFLVKCMDGFREFNHYCQTCGKKMASYSPNFTPGSIVLLIVLALLAVTLIGFACYFRMNPEAGRY